MATTASALAAPASARDTDAGFFARLNLGLALFIVFGFAQFQARGFVDVTVFPWYVHAHAAAMLAWLALIVVQPRLIARGDSRLLHRRLGWLGAAFLIAIVAFASMTGIGAIRLGFVPPFFSDAYFLALVHVGVLVFAGMVLWAIAMRHRTDWHRRLMIGSTVMILEPALGRLLPMPLIMPWGEWVALVFQLAALAILARHDLKTLGRVHPATLASAAVVTVGHVAFEALAAFPPFVALAASIAAG
jgi:hypothetical protein